MATCLPLVTEVWYILVVSCIDMYYEQHVVHMGMMIVIGRQLKMNLAV